MTFKKSPDHDVILPGRDALSTKEKTEKIHQIRKSESAYQYLNYYNRLAGKPKTKERKHFEKNINKIIEKFGADKPIIEKVRRGDTAFTLITRALKKWLKDQTSANRKLILKAICDRTGKKRDLTPNRGLQKLAAKIVADFASLGFDIGLIRADHHGQKPDYLLIRKGFIGIYPEGKIIKKNGKPKLTSAKNEAFVIQYLTPERLSQKTIPAQPEIDIPGVKDTDGKVLFEGYQRPALPAIPPATERPNFPAIPATPAIWKFTNKKTGSEIIAQTDNPGSFMRTDKTLKAWETTNISPKKLRDAIDPVPAVREIQSNPDSDSAVRVFRPFKTEKYTRERMYLERRHIYEKGKVVKKTQSQLSQFRTQVDRGPWSALTKLLGRNVSIQEIKKVYAKLHQVAQILKKQGHYKGSLPKETTYTSRGIADRQKNLFIMKMLRYIYLTKKPLPNSAKAILRGSPLRPVKAPKRKPTTKPATSRPTAKKAPKISSKPKRRPSSRPASRPTSRPAKTPKHTPTHRHAPTSQPTTPPKHPHTPTPTPKRPPTPTPKIDYTSTSIDEILSDFPEDQMQPSPIPHQTPQTPIQVYDDQPDIQPPQDLTPPYTRKPKPTRGPKQPSKTQPKKPAPLPAPPIITPEKTDSAPLFDLDTLSGKQNKPTPTPKTQPKKAAKKPTPTPRKPEKTSTAPRKPSFITGHANLEKALKKSPHSIVIFGPKWCGACKSVKEIIRNKKFNTQVISFTLSPQEEIQLSTIGTKLNKYLGPNTAYPFYREFNLDASGTPQFSNKHNTAGSQKILTLLKKYEAS